MSRNILETESALQVRSNECLVVSATWRHEKPSLFQIPEDTKQDIKENFESL